MERGDNDGLREELAEDDGVRWGPEADGAPAPFAVLQYPPLPPRAEDGPFSWRRAVTGVMTNLLGVGVLAMPRAVAYSGLLTGLVATLGMAMVMRETLLTLLAVGAQAGGAGRASYPELAKQILGPQGLAAVLLAILLYSAGLLAAELGALADALAQLTVCVFHADPGELSRGKMVLLALALSLPGALLRGVPKRGPLQGALCAAGVLTMLSLLLAVCLADLVPAGDAGGDVAHSQARDSSGEEGVALFYGGPLGLLGTCAILVAQFCLHTGALEVLPVPGCPPSAGHGEELEDLTPAAAALDSQAVLQGGFHRAAPLAAVVGAVGYMHFGGRVKGNMFASFSVLHAVDGWRWGAMLAARLACAAVLVVSFGCTSVSCRSAALEIFAARRAAGGVTSRKEHQVVAAVFVTCGLTAWLVEDLAALLCFLGAWAAGPLGLILPSLLSIELAKRQDGHPALSTRNLKCFCFIALGGLLMLGSVGSFLNSVFSHPAGSRGHRAVVKDFSGLRHR